MTLCVVFITGASVWLVLAISHNLGIGLWFIISLYLVYSLLCLRDLLEHASNVEKFLAEGDLFNARRALSWVVGRDTAALDETAIRRALVETLAENFSDGLAAPLFYLSFGGPILAWVYKAVNTLDSMIGYKNVRYLHFGWFAAKLDDAANFIPSRLGALLLVLAAKLLGLDYLNSYKLFRLEGRLHSSPNSGQTEAAAAGALGVNLGGPSNYGGEMVNKPVINSLGANPTEKTVKLALNLVIVASILTVALVALIEWVLIAFFGLPYGWGL
jgi:adenosylcobinamide-phosphate synthase